MAELHPLTSMPYMLYNLRLQGRWGAWKSLNPCKLPSVFTGLKKNPEY